MRLKSFVFIMAMLGLNNAFANEVYVEQIGSASTINITQEGSSNRIGDLLNPAFIGGGSNTVAIDQIGSNNTLMMVVNGASTNTTVTTNGSGNTQTINCGSTVSGSCSGSTITQVVTGDNNTITQDLGSGANHTSNINVTGDYNSVTHTSTGNAANSANITVNGGVALSGNTIAVTQSGINVQSVTVNSTGNSNNISIVQSD